MVKKDVLLQLLTGRRLHRAPSVESSRAMVHGLLAGGGWLCLLTGTKPVALGTAQTSSKRTKFALKSKEWYAISLQNFYLASFWNNATSLWEFAAALVRKGYLTQLENASEAGDLSSLNQADICWWRVWQLSCKAKAHETLYTGAWRAEQQ